MLQMSEKNKAIRTAKIVSARDDLRNAIKRTEAAILLTPTGEDRNALCDAQIHLAAALDKLQEIKIGDES